MVVINTQATATPEQQKAAESTIGLVDTVAKFIQESKKATNINFILTGIIIVLTIINVGVAVADKICK